MRKHYQPLKSEGDLSCDQVISRCWREFPLCLSRAPFKQEIIDGKFFSRHRYTSRDSCYLDIGFQITTKAPTHTHKKRGEKKENHHIS